MQTTSHLLMIRPVRFEYNAQTAVNNAFQSQNDESGVAGQAREEFNNFAALLQAHGLDLTIVDDTPDPHTPDSIFPNNWVSFHADGTLLLYPMFAENRRAERKPHVLEEVGKRFDIIRQLDLTALERQGIFLEGTGSMVLDRDHKLAYAGLSPRTQMPALKEFCRLMDYELVAFDATDHNGSPIYHTNVMMCVADRYVVICLDAVKDQSQRNHVTAVIQKSGKELIPITLEQMNRFAGNMLQVNNMEGQPLLIMSTQAYQSLTPEQVRKLESYNLILHSPLDTIEKNGGGSARCMLAEVFLEAKT